MRKTNTGGRGVGVFDPLLILYVCPLTQKLSIYNFNDRFICTHFRRDFVPLLLADTLQVIKVSRMTFGNSNLQLPPPIFYGIEVWRLARPLQDLNELLLDPLICCLGRVFWVIVLLEYPSTTHFQCPGWLQCPGPDSTWPCSLSLWCGAVVLSP